MFHEIGLLPRKRYYYILINRNSIFTKDYTFSLKSKHTQSAINVKTSKFSSKPSLQSNNTQSSTTFFTNPFLWYSQKLETHPFTTKCLTSAFIAGSGDLTCQYIVHSNNQELSKDSCIFKPDLLRTSQFSFLGFILVAPAVHLWYGFLMKSIPGTSIKSAIKRTIIDQFLFAPLFVSTFVSSLMTLKGSTRAEIQHQLFTSKGITSHENSDNDSLTSFAETITNLRQNYKILDIVISNWTLWIPAQLFNFQFVPGKYQVLFGNCVGFLWNIYLSWKTQDDDQSDEL